MFPRNYSYCVAKLCAHMVIIGLNPCLQVFTFCPTQLGHFRGILNLSFGSDILVIPIRVVGEASTLGTKQPRCFFSFFRRCHETKRHKMRALRPKRFPTMVAPTRRTAQSFTIGSKQHGGPTLNFYPARTFLLSRHSFLSLSLPLLTFDNSQQTPMPILLVVVVRQTTRQKMFDVQ